MRCPACNALLHTITVQTNNADALEVEICSQGCGGLWFDRFELKKVDENHEQLGARLIALSSQAKGEVLPGSRKRMCPKCSNTVLHRHFSSIQRSIEVDECPGCAGIWLDQGELASLRQEYTTEAERQQAAEEYLSRLLTAAIHQAR
jgi:hypothetical protein